MASKRDKQRVDALVAAGLTPMKLKGSEALALVQGRQRIKLVGDDGERTKAGKYWERKT